MTPLIIAGSNIKLVDIFDQQMGATLIYNTRQLFA